MAAIDASELSTGRDGVRALEHRYLAGLTLIALLLLANQALLRPSLLRLTTDAPVINLAGRQRMLSQRLAKESLALSVADADAASGPRRDLAETLALWSASHDRLRAGDPSLAPGGRNSPAVATAFDDLEPFYERMRMAAAALASDRSVDAPPALPALLASEREYLPRMDRIVGLYESESRARIRTLQRTGWILTAAVLLTIAGVGAFALRPATRTIRRQVSALQAARDVLDERVRERTVELEDANRSLVRANAELAAEHADRLAAEERHRRLLEQFGHAGRVNTMGEMTAGLAHELNQPLGAVANYVGGCLELLDRPDADLIALRGALEKAQAAALRAGEVLRRVRSFVTRGPVGREEVDPNRLVTEVAAFLRDEAARRGVTLETELAPDLPLLHGDVIQLQQVLVNLVRNAFDATAEVESPRVVVSSGRDSDGVVIAVADNGEGIPDHRIGRLFDPFFSTRAGGMGMGLAISRGIVEAHEGRLVVESVPGVHTVFRVILPLRTAPDAGPAR